MHFTLTYRLVASKRERVREEGSEPESRCPSIQAQASEPSSRRVRCLIRPFVLARRLSSLQIKEEGLNGLISVEAVRLEDFSEGSLPSCGSSFFSARDLSNCDHLLHDNLGNQTSPHQLKQLPITTSSNRPTHSMSSQARTMKTRRNADEVNHKAIPK